LLHAFAAEGVLRVIPPQVQVLIFLLSLWLAIYVFSRFFNLERRGVDVNPLYIIIKTKRLNNFLSRTSERHPRLWRAYGNSGMALALLETGLALYFLAGNLYRFAFIPQTASPVVPFLPGVTISLTWFPYVLIAIGLAITVHELAHGIIASREKVSVNSAGIILAPITAGGFVEPNEEEFAKARLLSRLRIVAAGSLTNVLVGVIVLLLGFAIFAPMSGVLVTEVVPGGPAEIAGMRDWDVIYAVQGFQTTSPADLQTVLARIPVGTTITIQTQRGPIQVTTASNPQNASVAFLGVQNILRYTPLRIGEFSSQFTYHLTLTLEWVANIMVNIGIFNMLPLFPLDGEAFVYNILKEKLKYGLKPTRITISVLCLCLMGGNIALTFIRYGLTPI
jgi:membrane-associated protease RseP (regulator of RpoE activity)